MDPLTEQKEKEQVSSGSHPKEKTRIQNLASQLSRGREDFTKKKRIKRWMYWILFLVIAVAGYSLWRFYQPATVATSFISYQRIGSTAQPILRLSGYVTYPRISVISAQTQTPITKLNFDIGDQVQAGNILAEFDHSELLSQRTAQLVTIRNLQETLQRTQNLYKGGAASDADLQNAQSQLSAAQANLDILNTKIESSIVRAPFSGLIIDKMVEVGEIATQGICRLADNSKILVTADVNQEDISKITSNTSAVVSLDAYPDIEYAGTIYEIMPTADPAKNTIQVKVALLNPDDRFKPNMSTKVFFTNEKVTQNAQVKAVLTVDKSAIIQQDGSASLFIIRDNRAIKKEVKLGQPIGDHLVEIVSGVEPDQRAIINPVQSHISDGKWVSSQ